MRDISYGHNKDGDLEHRARNRGHACTPRETYALKNRDGSYMEARVFDRLGVLIQVKNGPVKINDAGYWIEFH